jgi:hypothetical protein
MQLEAEELANRVSSEPDNTARIKKLYQLAFNRAPSESEIKVGLDYLRTEPMKEYEEEKNKPADTKGRRGGQRKGPDGGGQVTGKTDIENKAGGTLAAKPEGSTAAADTAVAEGSGSKPEAKAETKPEAQAETKPDAATASPETPAAEGDSGAAPTENAVGLMDGVPGMGGPGARRGAGNGAPPAPKYEPTARGRYAKILLSSSEFLFIN